MAQTSYSIVEARNQFTVLVRDVEKTAKPVEVTRRGKPVVVILSTEEYIRLMNNQPKRDFWTAYQQWRQKWHVDELGIDPDEIWGDVRDRTPVPDSDLWD
jgi:prevent-host-death family protein